jgi:transposase InsO family protein
MSRETSQGVATVSLMCEAFAISRQAYYAALRRSHLTKAPDRPPEAASDEESGVSVSVPGTACDQQRSRTWATTEELRVAIHEVVGEHSAWGVRKVWATLRRRGLRAGQKRVWAIMKADGLTMEPIAVRESPGRYGHVTVPESNRRWATDLTTVWTKDDGVVAVMPVIDCGDRFALACHVTKSQESGPVLAPVKQALVEQFGGPDQIPAGLELRTDHGPQYTGGDCEDLCGDWDVEHTFASGGPTDRERGRGAVHSDLENRTYLDARLDIPRGTAGRD